MGAAFFVAEDCRVVESYGASLYTGDFVSAEEAKDIGLYNQVVPRQISWRRRLERICRAIGTRDSAFAVAKTKEMLNRELNMEPGNGARNPKHKHRRFAMQHPDYREAYEAFVAKRQPKFS